MKKNSCSPASRRAPAAKAAHPIPTSRTIIDHVVMSGFIASAKRLSDKGAAFTLVHRDPAQGGDLAMRTYMFSEVRGQAVQIPWDLLFKGNEVIVRGLLRANNYLDKSGVSHREMDLVALEVIPNDGKTRFFDE